MACISRSCFSLCVGEHDSIRSKQTPFSPCRLLFFMDAATVCLLFFYPQTTLIARRPLVALWIRRVSRDLVLVFALESMTRYALNRRPSLLVDFFSLWMPRPSVFYFFTHRRLSSLEGLFWIRRRDLVLVLALERKTRYTLNRRPSLLN